MSDAVKLNIMTLGTGRGGASTIQRRIFWATGGRKKKVEGSEGQGSLPSWWGSSGIGYLLPRQPCARPQCIQNSTTAPRWNFLELDDINGNFPAEGEKIQHGN